MTKAVFVITIFVIIVVCIAQCSQHCDIPLHISKNTTKISRNQLKQQNQSIIIQTATLSPQEYEVIAFIQNISHIQYDLAMKQHLTEEIIDNSNALNELPELPHILHIWKLFNEFSFKGFGFTFAKSIIKWQNFGVGIRIPISPNFPKYSEYVYLPRVNTMVGCSYPLQFRWTVSCSLPLSVAILYARRCFELSMGYNITSSKKLFKRLKRPKFTDSYQRIGITIAIRYSLDSGFKYSLGSWVNYVPSKLRTETLARPVFLIPPAILITIANMIHPINVTDANIYNDQDFEANNGFVEDFILVNGTLRKRIRQASTRLAMIAKDSKCKHSKQNKYGKGVSSKAIRMRGIGFWHNMLQKWTQDKTLAVSGSLGWFRSYSDAFMGSNVNFDVSSFKPFKSIVKDISKKIVTLFERGKVFNRKFKI